MIKEARTIVLKTMASATFRAAEYFKKQLLDDKQFAKSNMTDVTASALMQVLVDYGEVGKNENGYYVTVDSLAVMMQALVKQHPSEISDGSHTFEELYNHRCVLFLCLITLIAQNGAQEFGVKRVWFSKVHDDGSIWDGYFVAGIETPFGNATYHLKDSLYLNLIRATGADELDQAPPYDGHNAQDVLDRLTWTFLSHPNQRL